MSEHLRPSIALAIAAIMLLAALSGMRAPRALAASIDAYRVLPGGAGRYLAVPLLLAEFVAGILLAAPCSRVAGALLASVLLFCFTAAVAFNVLRGSTDFDCGCAGSRALHPGLGVLLRNASLLFASLHVMRAQSPALDAFQFGGALVLLVCWHLWNEAIAMAQWPRDD